MKLKPPTEYEECVAFVEYLKLKNLLFTHIAQETYTKSWNQKRKNKAMGVRKGFPDYVIVVKNKLIFIEMKRKKGGVVSDEQAGWQNALKNISPNVYAEICYGADEAINFVEYIIKII